MSKFIILLIVLSLFTSSQSFDTTSSSSLSHLTTQQISQFRSTLNGRSLTGQWQCIQPLFFQPSLCQTFNIPKTPTNQLNNPLLYQPQSFFKSASGGSIEGFFYSSSSDTTLSDRLYLLIYEYKYRTGKVIEIDLSLSQAGEFKIEAERNQTKVVGFRQDGLIVTVGLFDGGEQVVKFDLAVNVEVFVEQKGGARLFGRGQEKDGKKGSISSEAIDTPIQIRILSQSLSISTSLTSPDHSTIMLLLLALTLVQCLLITIKPTTATSNPRTIMFRISQWFILQMYAFIFMFSKEYIQLGLKYYDTDLGYLVYLGLANIGLGLLFLRKYEVVLEKFINRKMLLRAVVFVVGYWMLTRVMVWDAGFWVVESALIMQLQIIHSMVNGGKGGLPLDLLGFMVVSRLPLMYMLSTEENIFRTAPASNSYLYLIYLTFAINWFVTYLQSRKGGQFMIPLQIIPGYYNYFYTQLRSAQKMKEQCSICTAQLGKAPDEALQLTEVQGSSIHSIQSSNEHRETPQISQQSIGKASSSFEDMIGSTVRYMKTPCNHLFHIDCLTKWMQAKLVCPNCRSTLPQLAELEKQ